METLFRMKINTENDRLRDKVTHIRKLSHRARDICDYKIFSMKNFRKKIDYAVFCNNDWDIFRISDVRANIKHSTQPFCRHVSKSIFLRALHPYKISKISDMRKQNYD